MAGDNKLKHSAQSSINSQDQVHRFIIDSAYYPDWLALHPEPRPDRGIYNGQQGHQAISPQHYSEQGPQACSTQCRIPP